MKTRIIVDSTSDLMPEARARVSVVPLTVHFGAEEFVDGVTIDHVCGGVLCFYGLIQKLGSGSAAPWEKAG